MFIFTAKFSRARAVITVLLLAVVVCCVILLAGARHDARTAGQFDAVVKNNAQRVEYLQSLGWDVGAEPLEEQSVIIPREFSQVYEDYNSLQKAQGTFRRMGTKEGISSTQHKVAPDTVDVMRSPLQVGSEAGP